MKRRSVALSLGALAVGSGATFTSGALQNTVNPTSTLEVYSVGELNVVPGSAQDEDLDYTSDYAPVSNGSDLPAAYVNGDTQNADLDVNVATRNSASSKDFKYLLEVQNNGTTDANVGIGFNSFGSKVDTTSISGSSGDISLDDVLDTYNFTANVSLSSEDVSGSDVDISPDSGTADINTPNNYKTVPSGADLAVDLTVSPSGSIVSDINTATGGANKAFDNSNTSGVTLVDALTIGTETS